MTEGEAAPPHLAALRLDELPGTISVWCGRAPDTPAFARLADHQHQAASLMKLPVLMAVYRAAAAGVLDPNRDVVLHDEFPSVLRGHYRTDEDYDNDDLPWQRLGHPASVRWLAERMVVSSSNLATDHLIELLGLRAVTACAPPGFAVRRPIGDQPALDAGLGNRVTAAAVGALLAGFVRGRSRHPYGDEVLGVLRRQQHRDGIAAGLPPGTPVGSKNGWIDGVRHDAAVVTPADAAEFVLVVCTAGLARPAADAITRRIAAAAWADRHALGVPAGQPSR